jgi:hypothetical protein
MIKSGRYLIGLKAKCINDNELPYGGSMAEIMDLPYYFVNFWLKNELKTVKNKKNVIFNYNFGASGR